MELNISLETVCRIIVRAQEYEAQVEALGLEDGSNPVDDDERGVLEDTPDNATADELRSIIDDLNEDEELDLIALYWVGRDSFAPEDWAEARDTARTERTHKTSDYLMGEPLLSAHLESGLDAFDLSCDDIGDMSD